MADATEAWWLSDYFKGLTPEQRKAMRMRAFREAKGPASLRKVSEITPRKMLSQWTAMGLTEITLAEGVVIYDLELFLSGFVMPDDVHHLREVLEMPV